jgi:hypothetical protein
MKLNRRLLASLPVHLATSMLLTLAQREVIRAVVGRLV